MQESYSYTYGDYSSSSKMFGAWLPEISWVVPFCPFYFRAPLSKPNSKKKGTLIVMGLLRNLVPEILSGRKVDTRNWCGPLLWGRYGYCGRSPKMRAFKHQASQLQAPCTLLFISVQPGYGGLNDCNMDWGGEPRHKRAVQLQTLLSCLVYDLKTGLCRFENLRERMKLARWVLDNDKYSVRSNIDVWRIRLNVVPWRTCILYD